MIPGLQGQFRLRAFHDSKGQNVPLSQNLDSKGTGQILSAQSMPQPVRVSQEGFRREESKPQGWRGRCFLENLGRVVTRQLMSIHAPTVWKAKRGEMQHTGSGLQTRKHFPKEKGGDTGRHI